MNLEKSVGPSKTPFVLSPLAALRRTLSNGERGLECPMADCAVNRSCFDSLSTNGSRHASTDFFRENAPKTESPPHCA